MRALNGWRVETGSIEDPVSCGNRFLTGNGYLGVRGTLEEDGKEQLAAVNLPGVFDRCGDKWRESVNAPNPLYAVFYENGRRLSARERETAAHAQRLDFSCGVHTRETVFLTETGGKVTVSSERFCHMAEPNLLLLRITAVCESDAELVFETGIDGDVWDINGPHLAPYRFTEEAGALCCRTETGELGIPVSAACVLEKGFPAVRTVAATDKRMLQRLTFRAEAGKAYEFTVYAAVSHEGALPAPKFAEDAAARGYEALRNSHTERWKALWRDADVEVAGDAEAQRALRYSIYQLLILRPAGGFSIPARGISGQTYKGAVFWDTEIFLLPFFLATDPAAARRLVEYRIRTLSGARRKAAEYGYTGAFYAWESQESGDDACSECNVTDVFTGRPVRTSFRDKQIHISGDVAYAVMSYCAWTGDESILLEGGAEAVLECARFFWSYACYKPERGRYELLDVTGPDEYHERVDNNAFTSHIARRTVRAALDVAKRLRESHPAFYGELSERLGLAGLLPRLNEFYETLYEPQPGPDGVIEQFGGYYKLENASVPEVRARLKAPNEYWGGPGGVAGNTQVIKQADVVAMLSLFPEDFAEGVKRACRAYYEPRTEHGSSLSACMYALLASELNDPDAAYPLFLNTASIDLTGKSKCYAGGVYIGGTHPAASGGAWLAAVRGFAGLTLEGGVPRVSPRLPKGWKGMRFRVASGGRAYRVEIAEGKPPIVREEGKI